MPSSAVKKRAEAKRIGQDYWQQLQDQNQRKKDARSAMSTTATSAAVPPPTKTAVSTARDVRGVRASTTVATTTPRRSSRRRSTVPHNNNDNDTAMAIEVAVIAKPKPPAATSRRTPRKRKAVVSAVPQAAVSNNDGENDTVDHEDESSVGEDASIASDQALATPTKATTTAVATSSNNRGRRASVATPTSSSKRARRSSSRTSPAAVPSVRLTRSALKKQLESIAERAPVDDDDTEDDESTLMMGMNDHATSSPERSSTLKTTFESPVTGDDNNNNSAAEAAMDLEDDTFSMDKAVGTPSVVGPEAAPSPPDTAVPDTIVVVPSAVVPMMVSSFRAPPPRRPLPTKAGPNPKLSPPMVQCPISAPVPGSFSLLANNASRHSAVPPPPRVDLKPLPPKVQTPVALRQPPLRATQSPAALYQALLGNDTASEDVAGGVQTMGTNLGDKMFPGLQATTSNDESLYSSVGSHHDGKSFDAVSEDGVEVDTSSDHDSANGQDPVEYHEVQEIQENYFDIAMEAGCPFDWKMVLAKLASLGLFVGLIYGAIVCFGVTSNIGFGKSSPSKPSAMKSESPLRSLDPVTAHRVPERIVVSAENGAVADRLAKYEVDSSGFATPTIDHSLSRSCPGPYFTAVEVDGKMKKCQITTEAKHRVDGIFSILEKWSNHHVCSEAGSPFSVGKDDRGMPLFYYRDLLKGLNLQASVSDAGLLLEALLQTHEVVMHPAESTNQLHFGVRPPNHTTYQGGDMVCILTGVPMICSV